MGNWFGSESPAVQRESVTIGSRITANYPSSRGVVTTTSTRVTQPREYDALSDQLARMRVGGESAGRYVSSNSIGGYASHTGRTSVRENPLREQKLLRPASNISFVTRYISSYTGNWEGDWASTTLNFVTLDPYSNEYSHVKGLFDYSNKRCFQVTHIERIQNPYLLAAFLMKKEEMEQRVGHQNIEELFHGTKRQHVQSICTDNLDWRLYGQNIGNKFGQGISFSPISNYATHYGDDTQDNRVMLLVHVLVGNECVGTKDMVLPPAGFDTTIKPDRHVIVKYEDNEFYPAYKITYWCTDMAELTRRKNNNNNRRIQKVRPNRISHVFYDDDY